MVDKEELRTAAGPRVRPELPRGRWVQVDVQRQSNMGISGRAVAFSWLFAIAVALIAALLNAA